MAQSTEKGFLDSLLVLVENNQQLDDFDISGEWYAQIIHV